MLKVTDEVKYRDDSAFSGTSCIAVVVIIAELLVTDTSDKLDVPESKFVSYKTFHL